MSSMNRPVLKALLACGLIVSGAVYATSPQAAAIVQATQDPGAETAIRTTVGQYFQGHATGDPSYFRKSFLSTARIEGNRQGKLVSWTLEDYCALFKGTPAKDESTRTRRIDSVDVSGDAAMVKATLDYGAIVFTDYIILLKVDGEWKIANKVYFGQRRS